MNLHPATVEELQDIIKTEAKLLPVGGGSKPPLSGPRSEVTRLDMSQLQGIIEYEPGEYTFTAYAGTPLAEVQAALAEHGQYMPFDPLLVEQGATLGGLVATNTAGSGRYRFGGVRDFIIGLHFVDGQGQLVRGGGKVVKNSAGFDLPKFMVGSLGRFGLFVNISFKVFPQPRAYVTLQTEYASLSAALQAIYKLAPSVLEMDVLDLEPLPEGRFALLCRLGGLPAALPGRIERLRDFLQRESEAGPTQLSEGEADASLWQRLNALAWAPPDTALVKVPLSLRRVPLLENVLQPNPPPRRYSAGGNVAWLAVADTATLDRQLDKLDLSGLVLLGPPGRAWLGQRQGLALLQRLKQALDPTGKFLEI